MGDTYHIWAWFPIPTVSGGLWLMVGEGWQGTTKGQGQGLGMRHGQDGVRGWLLGRQYTLRSRDIEGEGVNEFLQGGFCAYFTRQNH